MHSATDSSVSQYAILKAYDMAHRERSDEVWAWYAAVYEAVQEIPYGRVTSYGHIAKLVGKRR
jgi:O6-methylguanine-DNA--protein-cysteine methyltransferase